MRYLSAFLLLLFVSITVSAQETRKIFGKVSDGKNPIENVTISIENKEISTISKIDGSYELSVQTGDKVNFTYTGLRTVSIKIEDVTRVLNPIMIPDVTELEEVTVEASKRRSQKDMAEDYPINQDIIRTAWGYVDAKRSPGQVWTMGQDDISDVRLCILDLLQNRFPGIKVVGNCTDGGFVTSRRFNTMTQGRGFLFDVDGQLFSEAPIWLPVQSMRRIAIFPGLAMAARYGNLGSGGIIVINTINGNPQIEKFVDRARLKNNYADGKALSKSQVASNAPQYLKELRASTSLPNSKRIFEEYQKTYFGSPYFVLDAYEHFITAYDAKDYADNVIKTNYQLFENNPVLLKALAYTYESQQRYKKANEVYKDVFIHRPNYLQSYMDMANSYRNIKEIKKAASMYARYEYLIEEGFLTLDTVGFGPIMNREYNNLLALEKNTVVKSNKAKKLYVAEEEFEGTRLVFEWNDGEAEFDVQFVNPENQYYTWKHSLAESSNDIELEKEYGYNVKEYLVDGSLPGTWKVNVNYLGNKSLSPTYLKVSIYSNYGSRFQSKEVKVFKLSLKNVNQELFSLQSNSKMLID